MEATGFEITIEDFFTTNKFENPRLNPSKLSPKHASYHAFTHSLKNNLMEE